MRRGLLKKKLFFFRLRLATFHLNYIIYLIFYETPNSLLRHVTMCLEKKHSGQNMNSKLAFKSGFSTKVIHREVENECGEWSAQND